MFPNESFPISFGSTSNDTCDSTESLYTQPRKRKKYLTLKEKYDLINKFEVQNMNKSVIAKEYQVARSCVIGIIKNRDRIIEHHIYSEST